MATKKEIPAKKTKPKKRAPTKKGTTKKKKVVAKKKTAKKVVANTNSDYYGFKEKRISCSCGWRGLGKDTEAEHFTDLFKFYCPDCDTGLGLVEYPFDFQTRAAAGQGNPEAISDLKGIKRAKIQAARILASQIDNVSDLSDFADQTIDIELWLDGEGWETNLVIGGNGTELGRELCFFESIEPVERLLPLLTEKFGGRLKTFKWERAELYLCGDKSSLGGQIFNLIKSYGLN